MSRLLNRLIALLIVVVLALLCSRDTQANTVAELLNAMQKKRLNIQDFQFVVNRNFYEQAFNEREIEISLEKLEEEFLRNIEEPTETQLERHASTKELTALLFERSITSGTLYQIKGIGSKTVSYAICLLDDPQRRQLMELYNTPLSERGDPGLYSIPDIKMKFGQHRVVLPDYVVNGWPNDAHTDANIGLFVFPPHSQVVIEDNLLNTYRFHYFPFWHEEVLHFATVDNTTIVSENEEEIELLISLPQTPPINFTFLLYCNRDGRAHRVIKKANDEIIYVQDYLHFVEMSPEGIEIPLVGRMWEPAMGLGSAHPSQETTHICTIVHSAINIGLTLDDLAIEAPAGTTVIDRRGNRTFVVDSLDSTDTITTTRPVRLGANLPDDIRELNDSAKD